MDVKKISVIAVITAILFIVGYFVYSKLFAKKESDSSSGSDSSSSGGSSNAVIDPLELALSNLSATDKADAYNVASSMYEDCKGWNSHNMSTYDYLDKWSSAKFYFFVKTAYPSYDKNNSLTQRLKMQNWSKLDKWSKNRGYNESKAKELINKIIYRVENFTL